MQMGMILQLPSPGVQHAEEADVSRADKARVGGELFEGFGGGGEHGVISWLGMGAYAGPQRLGHGEGDQEVGTRQQLLQALVKPVGSLFMLAARAVAIAAGAVSGMQLSAGRAFIETGAESAAAAVHDGLCGFAVVWGRCSP